MAAQLLQTRLDIGQRLKLRRVQRLQAAGTHQAFGHRIAREDQVVTTAAGHQLGFQHFTAIHDVVDHLDAGFGGEPGQRVFGKVIRPVVQAQGLVLGLRRGQAGPQRQAEGEQQMLVADVHVTPLESSSMH
ncbi:hypothetical protein D3C79_762500 [compost metagenome]